MISHPLSRDVIAASLKTAPPLTVWALTLNEWVAIATLCYVVLQAAYLVWKWHRESNAKTVENQTPSKPPVITGGGRSSGENVQQS